MKSPNVESGGQLRFYYLRLRLEVDEKKHCYEEGGD